MPKIRVLGGFTDATTRGLLPAVAETVPGVEVESDVAGTGESVNAETGEVTQPGGPLAEIPQTEGEPLAAAEEEPCPGSSSETSPAKPPKSDEPAKGNRRKRARTTGSRSRQGQAGSSSASSTATSGRGTGA